MKIKLLTIILLVLTVSSAWAFDGQRKGFVIGGGLGFGPVARTSLGNLSEDESGIALNIAIGYAWDEQNMIVYLRDGVIFKLESYFTSVNIIQGFSGVGYYHYFGPIGQSFFVTGGIGFQDYTALDSKYSSPSAGGGILLGGGYEFSKHWQIYSSLSFGKTGSGIFKTDHSQFIITLSGIAF